MKTAIEVMLSKYSCKAANEYKNAIKEIIQEIALLGLWRSKFFENAAFYGGTALRIFYQLNRFSEDLDFSLLNRKENFKLDKYNEAIIAELQSFGFDVNIENKNKNIKTNIDTTILKANTKLQFLNISAPLNLIETIHHQENIIIKMEIDIDPPLNFDTEMQILLNPIPFEVNIFQLPDLFATKVYAMLCRNWKTRVKGRDWYDFIFYISQNVPLKIKHLESRLIKNSEWDASDKLTKQDIIQLLTDKINQIDFITAKKDVQPFISDYQSLSLWSKDFFLKLLPRINFI